MGKPTGFMEHKRESPPLRAVGARLSDWLEFHEPAPESLLREQGARCMDCGVPFCHSGTIVNGSALGCPINNLIPEWNDLVYRDDWRGALDRLLRTNNFPEFTGRVCPAPCEGSCVLGINEAPVTIKTIEQAIIDKAFDAGWIVPRPPAVRTGKQVAIVGSGPAGLACASQLNAAGHSITVFERSDRAGGLLTYGIPNMKLEKSIVQRRLNLLAQEGVSFMTDTTVGETYDTERLMDQFQAIVLCGGAARPRDLTVDGRSLSGIHFAMEFLSRNTRSLLDSDHRDGNFLSAKDRDVVVIGGGDTGTDCVATALRQGCRSLVQFEILPRPPDGRSTENPWPQWPKIYRLDYGQQEAAHLFGQDPRTFSVMTREFLGDNGGHLRGVRTVDVEWTSAGPRELAGTEKDWRADLVLLALGFLGPETKGLLSQLGIAIDLRGNVAVDAEQRTNVAQVFAAGDMSRGQSLVVWAIADGRRAARGVDRFLMGGTSLP
jgi:glutamate synthase (NADPH/NADH) small chain